VQEKEHICAWDTVPIHRERVEISLESVQQNTNVSCCNDSLHYTVYKLNLLLVGRYHAATNDPNM